jgi:hypothetical protein
VEVFDPRAGSWLTVKHLFPFKFRLTSSVTVFKFGCKLDFRGLIGCDAPFATEEFQVTGDILPGLGICG